MQIKRKFFFAQIHKALRFFPHMLIGICILAILGGVLCFSTMQLFGNSANGESDTVSVGLVTNHNEAYLDFAMDLVTQMNSIKTHFSFVYVEEADGMRMLENGEIVALMILPDHVMEGILSGSNAHARVILSKKDPLSSILMQEIAKSASALITSSQSDIYSAADLYQTYDVYDHVQAAFDTLNLQTLRYALSRNALFRPRTVSATGSIHYSIYYLCSAFLFILLCSGISYILFFHRGSKDLRLKMQSAGLHSVSLSLPAFVSTFMYQGFVCILLYIGVAIYFTSLGVFTPDVALSILVLILILQFASSSFLFMLLSLSPASPTSVIILFLLTGVLMLGSGCFVPLAFLPAGIRLLSAYLPTSLMQFQLFHIFSFADTSGALQYRHLFDGNCVSLVLYSVVFLCIGFLFTYAIDKRRIR